MIRFLAVIVVLACAVVARAAPPDLVFQLAAGESDEKVAALNTLVVEADDSVPPLLQAFLGGNVQFSPSEKRVFIVADGKGSDAVTGKPVSELPVDLEDVIVNNRLRRELDGGIAALKLVASDPATRLAAAAALQGTLEESRLPIIERALEKETDPRIKGLLELTRAAIQVRSADPETRLAAVRALGESSNPATKTVLLSIVEKTGDTFVEPNTEVRAAAERSLRSVERRLATGERIGQIFSGISLGSILLLAALGLAITYGLMGVINMAHGELMMIGAYATYVMQNLFRSFAPELFDFYLAAAVPVSFAVSAVVGMVLERVVIRHLYGRPLETLLATWGISLILIQTVRTIFGAQNVQVENPVWMSGGLAIMTDVVLPWSRVIIIGFALVVLLAVWLVLTRIRLGLFVRAVTQNRAMASCVGVRTGKIDMWAFGLGSGLAGLAGCALSQVGNVGPDLGQSYIVDSFLVVVLGGVGQLAGTVYAAFGLGIVNKFLEGWAGAVVAKIAVLLFIIVFIQRRPQGLFALKGRTADA